MTPEAMRIAIAEACGWTNCKPVGMGREKGIHPLNQKFGDVGYAYWNIPLYDEDLNAIHEAEKTLTPVEADQCDRHLERIMFRNDRDDNWVGGYRNVTVRKWHATAAQRCEAFLKAKNLWKEGK